MQGDEKTEAARRAAFSNARPAPAAKSAWFRDQVRNWKAGQRAAAKERHAKRASKCEKKDLIRGFYESAGKEFENVFENILDYLEIDYKKLDVKGKAAAPDYLINLVKGSPIVVELKSRDGALIDLNRAMEVLGASEIHGYKGNFCSTLCHPGVDPAVPPAIVECGRLSVVESVDLGEALLRMCEKNLSSEQVHAWLTTPGQALAADLPYKQFND
jgi:helicase